MALPCWTNLWLCIFQNLISSTAESGYDFITIPIVNPRSLINQLFMVVCDPCHWSFVTHVVMILSLVNGQAWKRVPDWQACQQTQWTTHKVRLTRVDHSWKPLTTECWEGKLWTIRLLGSLDHSDFPDHNGQSVVSLMIDHPDRRPWCRSFSRYDLMSHLRLMPWFRSDLLLASSDWGSLVVGRISPTIDVDSPLPSVRANSEARLMQELK